MHNFLKKQVLGIPLVFILILALVGTAFAVYQVWSQTYTIDVIEPFVVTEIDTFPAEAYPGENIGASYNVTNNSGKAFTARATWPTDPIVKCSIWFYDEAGDLIEPPDIKFSMVGEWSAWLPANSSIYVELLHTIADDTPSGEISIETTISRD